MGLTKKLELHKPVLLDEVIKALKVSELAPLKAKAKYIDATVGLGGHAIRIWSEGVKVLGIDLDRESLKVARSRIRKILFEEKDSELLACPLPVNKELDWKKIKLVYGNFKDIDVIAKRFGFEKVDGILFDLGISSYQLEKELRGFSFKDISKPLDMRIDPKIQKIKASDLIKILDRKKLIRIFKRTLDEDLARRITQKILEERAIKDIRKVSDFLGIIRKVRIRRDSLHPATLPFLALRMAVNSELENLEESLPKAFGLLKRGGRLVVITFHSGEDRIVKNFFKNLNKELKARILTKRPIVPSQDQILENPRARSAKMRILEKI